MADYNKYAFPLIIAGAVASVYLLFRKSSGTVVVNQPATQTPQLAQTPQYLAAPDAAPAMNPLYIADAATSRYADNPSNPTGGGPGDNVTYNVPSWLDRLTMMAPGYGSAPAMSNGNGKSGGCGGGCGGCKDPCDKKPCASNVYTNDGRNVCLGASSPTLPYQVPITGYSISSAYLADAAFAGLPPYPSEFETLN